MSDGEDSSSRGIRPLDAGQYSTPALDRDMHGPVMPADTGGCPAADYLGGRGQLPDSFLEGTLPDPDSKVPDPTFEQIGRDLVTIGEKITHVNEGVKDCWERLFVVCNRFDGRLNELLGCPPGTISAPGPDPDQDGNPGIRLDEAAYNVGRMMKELDRLSDQINRL